MKKRLNFYLIILVLVISVVSTAHAMTYTFSTINAPFPQNIQAMGIMGINDSGDIVGYYSEGGFLIVGGNFTTFGIPGATNTGIMGINDSGNVVGWYQDAKGYHGFLIVGGNFIKINVPGAIDTYAYGINNSSQIAGYYSEGTRYHGFLYVGGNFTTINVPGAIDTYTYGIDDSGDIVGWYQDANSGGKLHGFLYSEGNFTTIDVPGGVISSISGPSQGTPGGRISIQNTVTNQGTLTSSKATVNFYLSSDTQINSGDTLIGKRSIPSLAPGASSGPVYTMVTIPKNITQGSYFIGGIVGNSTNFDPKGIIICLSLSKLNLLAPKNRGINVSTTPALSWSNVSGVSYYEVQVATDSGFTNIVASMTGLTSSKWTVTTPLSGGTTYFWRARAVNPCGPGPWSMSWSFKTM